jgi:hypothetical protein
MKKIVKITESDISKLVQRVLQEQESPNYMFFSNLEQLIRQANLLLELDQDTVDEIILNGHDWAADHVTVAKENLDQVFDFMMNQIKGKNHEEDEEEITSPFTDDGNVLDEGKKKTGTKLCSRGYAAAKSKFKVFPSAYSNGYGVQVCKGTMPGLDGKKRCSPPYC